MLDLNCAAVMAMCQHTLPHKLVMNVWLKQQGLEK